MIKNGKYYYDIRDRLLNYNANMYISMGVRRAGKTYSCKNMVIKKYLKTGEQFVWLRVLDKDIQTAATEEFYRELQKEFPNVEFKFAWRNKLRVLLINEEVAGYFISLKDDERIKGSSFECVRYIIFDEFLKVKERRERNFNPVFSMLNIMDTIDNRRDVVKIIMLANRVSYTNPYFKELQIEIPENTTSIYKHPTLPIVVELVYDECYAEERKNSNLGQIFMATQYGKHAIENEGLFSLKSGLFDTLPTSAICYFSLKYYDDYINVFHTSEITYCKMDTKALSRVIMAITSTQADEDRLPYFVNYRKKLYYKYVQDAITDSRIMFNAVDCKEIVLSNVM